MKINGIGIIKAIPDAAITKLGVVTENRSLEAAQDENAIKSADIINGLYQMGIPKRQIRTVSYTIEPQYDYIDSRQVFRGYKVTNIMSITISGIDMVGEIVDNSVSRGANRVDSIVFTISEPSIFYNQALGLAVKDAVRKAGEIGTTLGVEVNAIPYKIVEEKKETAAFDGPLMRISAPETPILSGEITITARIEASFNYSEY